MADDFIINIRNDASQAQFFYVFQQQTVFKNAGTQPTIRSNSLGTGNIAPYKSSGTTLSLPLRREIFAGAQTNDVKTIRLRNMMPSPNIARQQNEPTASAIQPVKLTGNDPENHTSLSLSPLGLSAPSYDDQTPVDNFGIRVPSFQPEAGTKLWCGNATKGSKKAVVLSSFVSPTPNSTLYCAPKQIFYVKTGNYPEGEEIQYAPDDKAAKCDFSGGFSYFSVVFNADGTFSTTGS